MNSGRNEKEAVDMEDVQMVELTIFGHQFAVWMGKGEKRVPLIPISWEAEWVSGSFFETGEA